MERPRVDRRSAVRVAVIAAVAAFFGLVVGSRTVSDWIAARIPDYAPVLRGLPRYEGQNGDPDPAQLDPRIRPVLVRRAAEVVPDNALYYIHASDPFAESLERLARLYFLPALAVRDPSRAGWILSFRFRAPPQGTVTSDVIRVSPELSLYRVVTH